VDTTKIKVLEEETRRLMGALSESPTAIFGQSADLTYEWAFGNLGGLPAAQMLGRRDGEIFSDGGKAFADLKLEVMRDRQALRRRLDFPVDGTRRTHDVFLQPTVNDQGEVVGVNGVVTQVDGASGDPLAQT
jgi:hypothetical protein